MVELGYERHGDEMDMRERSRQVNADTYAAWIAHDPDAIAAVFADHAEIVDITSGVVLKGRDEIRATAVARLTGFPDFSLENREILVDDNRCANRWIMRGTHQAEYMGLPASGRAVEINGASFSEFNEDALMVRDFHYVDVPALLRQLGLE